MHTERYLHFSSHHVAAVRILFDSVTLRKENLREEEHLTTTFKQFINSFIKLSGILTIYRDPLLYRNVIIQPAKLINCYYVSLPQFGHLNSTILSSAITLGV